jgi:hypothetical protein
MAATVAAFLVLAAASAASATVRGGLGSAVRGAKSAMGLGHPSSHHKITGVPSSTSGLSSAAVNTPSEEGTSGENATDESPGADEGDQHDADAQENDGVEQEAEGDHHGQGGAEEQSGDDQGENQDDQGQDEQDQSGESHGGGGDQGSDGGD